MVQSETLSLLYLHKILFHLTVKLNTMTKQNKQVTIVGGMRICMHDTPNFLLLLVARLKERDLPFLCLYNFLLVTVPTTFRFQSLSISQA